MKIYLVFLRGINVSGQKKIKMADLKQLLLTKGFKTVETYIQSGNIVVHCEKEKTEVSNLIRSIICEAYGFDVPNYVTTPEEVYSILSKNPFQNLVEENKNYFVLLLQKPDENLIFKFEKESYKDEEFKVDGDCVFLACKAGMGKARLNNNLIERKLKIQATTRNLRTIRKMLEIASIN